MRARQEALACRRASSRSAKQCVQSCAVLGIFARSTVVCKCRQARGDTFFCASPRARHISPSFLTISVLLSEGSAAFTCHCVLRQHDMCSTGRLWHVASGVSPGLEYVSSIRHAKGTLAVKPSVYKTVIAVVTFSRCSAVKRK
jgi:hypothetical protein